MFGKSSSNGHARLRSLAISIAGHALVIVMLWRPTVFKNAISGIQVVHAAAIETTELTLVNRGSTVVAAFRPRCCMHRARAEARDYGSNVPQLEETDDFPLEVAPALKISFNSAMTDQMVPRNLQDIKLLELGIPESIVPPPPENGPENHDSIAPDVQGGGLEPARLLRKVVPVYPPVAKAARVQGSVVIEATITESGTLDDVTVVAGHPMLIESAVDAVRQWRYEPAKLNGRPARSSVTIRVNFKLDFQ